MQIEIVFKREVKNSEHGNFIAGDTMRCGKELAEHFVTEGLAVYTGNTFAEVEQAAPVEQKATTPNKRNKPQSN